MLVLKVWFKNESEDLGERIKLLILGLSNIGNEEESSKLDWEEMVRKEETNQVDVLQSKWRKCFQGTTMVLKTYVKCYWINMKSE